MHLCLSTYRYIFVHSGAHLAHEDSYHCVLDAPSSLTAPWHWTLDGAGQGKLPAQVLGLKLRTVRSGHPEIPTQTHALLREGHRTLGWASVSLEFEAGSGHSGGGLREDGLTVASWCGGMGGRVGH